MAHRGYPPFVLETPVYDVTASRSTATVYQNTGNTTKMVMVTFLLEPNTTGKTATGLCDAGVNPTTAVSALLLNAPLGDALIGQLIFLVPRKYYYNVVIAGLAGSATVEYWYEISLGATT